MTQALQLDLLPFDDIHAIFDVLISAFAFFAVACKVVGRNELARVESFDILVSLGRRAAEDVDPCITQHTAPMVASLRFELRGLMPLVTLDVVHLTLAVVPISSAVPATDYKQVLIGKIHGICASTCPDRLRELLLDHFAAHFNVAVPDELRRRLTTLEGVQVLADLHRQKVPEVEALVVHFLH